MGAEWRSTVRSRVAVGATLVLAVALLITVFASSGLIRRALIKDTDQELIDRIDSIADLAAAGPVPAVLTATGHEVGQLQLVDASGKVVSATPAVVGGERFDVVPAPTLGNQVTATVDGGVIGARKGEKFRLVARTVASPTGPLTIYATASINTAARAERYLRSTLLIGAAILLVIAAGGVWLVVGRAFAPVDAMRAEVDRIEVTDLSGRVHLGSSDNEVAKLGATLNRMLDRLEAAATRQRLFAAAASHELRSPLSAIRTEVEVALLFPESAEWPTIGQDVLVEVARLESLSRDLRALNRSTAPSNATLCDLTELVRREVGLRNPARGVAYRSECRLAIAVAQEDGVVQVLRNLFDNAERHATSIVTVTLEADSTGATLRVSNDGEPIPAAERDRIFEPFMRLDEARSLDIGGSGLGLAIARSIMQGFGGSLVASDVSSGAEFVAWFPPTTQPAAAAG